MNFKEKAKCVVIGALAAILVTAGIIPSIAAGITKTIQVSTGVTIYVDDVKLNPTDGNGNPVEAFIYNGTTYLPVKAIGQAYSKDVQWEGKSRSVYVGKHVSTEPNALLAELDYFKYDGYDHFWSKKQPGLNVIGGSYQSACEKDNLGNMHENIVYGSFDRTYLLNGNYSEMIGTLYQSYDSRSNNAKSTLEVYGDGKLIYEGKMEAGVKPIDFNINLRGVLEMRIVFNYINASSGGSAVLGEVGLYH